MTKKGNHEKMSTSPPLVVTQIPEVVVPEAATAPPWQVKHLLFGLLLVGLLMAGLIYANQKGLIFKSDKTVVPSPSCPPCPECPACPPAKPCPLPKPCPVCKTCPTCPATPSTPSSSQQPTVRPPSTQSSAQPPRPPAFSGKTSSTGAAHTEASAAAPTAAPTATSDLQAGECLLLDPFAEDPVGSIMLCSRSAMKELAQPPSLSSFPTADAENDVFPHLQGPKGPQGSQVPPQVPPQKPQKPPVPSLDTSSDTDSLVVKYYFVPNCPSCQSFTPEWNKLAHMFLDDPRVRFDTIDGSTPEGSAQCLRASVNGKPVVNFPTVSAAPQKTPNQELLLRSNGEDAKALSQKMGTLLKKP